MSKKEGWRFRLATSEALISETRRALDELDDVLGSAHHEDKELYEIKAELNEPLRAKLALSDGLDGPIVGDLTWVWDGTRWGAES